MAISGNTAIIGAPRDDDLDNPRFATAYAYEFVSTDEEWLWSRIPSSQPVMPHPVNKFGSSVAFDGSTVIIRAPEAQYANAAEDKFGTAYFFVKGTGGWQEQAKLQLSLEDSFHLNVAISGNRAIVGASGGGDSVYVFVNNRAGEWQQQAKLTASDAADDDKFGYSVAISGDTAIIGAPIVSR